MSERTSQQCPGCGRAEVLTREEPWEPWTCSACKREFRPCGRCEALQSQYADPHGIEQCIAALGERLTKLETEGSR